MKMLPTGKLLLSVGILGLGCLVPSVAEAATSSNSLLTPGNHSIVVDGQTVNVTTTLQDGQPLFTSTNRLTPKLAHDLTNLLNNAVTPTSSNTASSSLISPQTSSGETLGAWADSYKGDYESYGDFQATVSGWGFSRSLSAQGDSAAYWNNSSFYPTDLIVSSSITINSSGGLTLSVPPGFSGGSSSSNITFTGNAGSTNYVDAPYSLTATAIGFDSYSQTDGVAALYDGSYHRTYDTESASWLTGEISYTPTGGSY